MQLSTLAHALLRGQLLLQLLHACHPAGDSRHLLLRHQQAINTSACY
jgi:hypothetical protein